MNKGVKFRIYPNKKQENLMLQTFGCCRLIYNKGLDMREKAYKNGGKANYTTTCKMVTELKHKKNLSVREWECPKCHTKHDRDINASINIINRGLSLD